MPVQPAWHVAKANTPVHHLLLAVHSYAFRLQPLAQTAAVHLERLRSSAHRNDPQYTLAFDPRDRDRATRFTYTASRSPTTILSRRTAPLRLRRTRAFLLLQTTPCPEVLKRVPHLLVRQRRVFAEHAVHARVEIVHPLGERVSVSEHLGTVLGGLQVRHQVVTTLSTREHMLQTVEKRFELPFLLCGWVAWVVHGDSVQCHPQTRPPHPGEKTIAAVEVHRGERGLERFCCRCGHRAGSGTSRKSPFRPGMCMSLLGGRSRVTLLGCSV